MVKGTTVAIVAGVVAVVGIIGYVLYSGEQELGKFLENFKLPELPGFPNITFPNITFPNIPSVDLSGLENWLSTQWPFNTPQPLPTNPLDVPGTIEAIKTGKANVAAAFKVDPASIGTFPATHPNIITYTSGVVKGELPVGGVSAPE